MFSGEWIFDRGGAALISTSGWPWWPPQVLAAQPPGGHKGRPYVEIKTRPARQPAASRFQL